MIIVIIKIIGLFWNSFQRNIMHSQFLLLLSLQPSAQFLSPRFPYPLIFHNPNPYYIFMDPVLSLSHGPSPVTFSRPRGDFLWPLLRLLFRPILHDMIPLPAPLGLIIFHICNLFHGLSNNGMKWKMLVSHKVFTLSCSVILCVYMILFCKQSNCQGLSLDFGEINHCWK